MADESTVRASSWGTLFDCAYRWEAEQLLGMRKPLSHAMLLGKALHRSTAVFDGSRMAEKKAISASESADVFVDTLWHPGEEVQPGTNEGALQDAEITGLILHKRYCAAFHYRQYKAVELTTEPLEVAAQNGHVITLTGTLDRSRVRKHYGGIGITDLKTGKQAVNPKTGQATTKNHGMQLGVYELLAEHSLGERITEPAEIIGLSTGAKPLVGTGTVEGASRNLIGTENQLGLIDLAGVMLQTGAFYPNPNSPFCKKDFCPRWEACTFHG